MAWQPNAVTATSGLVTSRKVGITGNTERTVFSVMRRDTGRLMIAGLGNAGTGGAYFGVADQFDGMYLPATMATDNKVPVSARSWNVLEAVYDGNNLDGYVNGQLKISATYKTKTADAPLELGARTVASGTKWRAAASDGDFAELLVYDRALTRAERRQVENYLAVKWLGKKGVSAQTPLVWRDTELDDLSAFKPAPTGGDVVLTVTNATGGTLWRLNPSGGAAAGAVRLAHDNNLGEVQWVGPGQYIYAGSDQGRRVLYAGDLTGAAPVALVDFQTLRGFQAAPELGKIMAWGTVSNEPAAGLWEFDTGTKTLRSLLPYSEAPSPFAREIIPATTSIKLASGATVTCTIFTPMSFDRHHKYPLVLGDTYVPDAIHGVWLQSGMAAGGAFVVFVNRPYWEADIAKWEENVRAVYAVLKKNPCIDQDRVFLIGASAETGYMRPCLESTPGLWKGAILLNPSALPDFDQSPRWQRRPKIFISAGSEEQEEDRFKQWQQKVQPAGVVAEYLIAPTENHRFIGLAAKQARLKAINHFIFEE